MEGQALPGRLRSVLPVFLVENVIASAEYYRDRLGFRIALVFPKDHPVLAIVDRTPGEGFHLAYGAGFPPRKNRAVDGLAVDAYIHVNDIAAVYEELPKIGSEATAGVSDRERDSKELILEDPNGFVLGFRQEETTPPAAYKVCPQLLVEDAASSAEWYQNALGFESDIYDRGGGTEARLRREGVTIYLRSSRPPRMGRSNRGRAEEVERMWDAYVEVDGIWALWEEFRRRGVRIVRALEATDYGTEEFEVQDADGYVLCFAQILPA